MNQPYKLTNQAGTDLDQIWDYIARDDPLAADHFIERLLRTCMLLAQSPRIGRVRADLAKDLRSHPVGNYLIFYRVLTDAIEIVRVIHGGRNLHAIFASFEG
jgi:toxin ParE1/3/4